jgi:hypothetical protein
MYAYALSPCFNVITQLTPSNNQQQHEQLTVESIAFMLSKRLAVKIKGSEAAKAIEKKYCTRTPEEAKGNVSFPEGPTLRGEYCAW